ncbi:NAD(P)-dependent oxidoreductase [Olsenella sp. An290]|uniref:NAD-dependent epimerase/dehydratase family protein n=1 Tax=Olsenella sp. An290 TaxID=1965625 RepID=UPI001302432E|nr:NAD(P)-dependent oxidoreductase [Olsenella sp. An290]
MTRKRIVVFGATGTLGLYTVDWLASNLSTEWEVIATGRRPVTFFESAYPDMVSYAQVNIDDESTFASLPQENVYAVVHFAGALPAYMEGYDPRAYVRSNVMGTLNVLEYARKSGAGRIIYTQTISDYDGYFGKQTELMDDMPRRVPFTGDHSVYAITKCAAEDICRNYEQEYGIAFFGLRLPNIYCYMPESKTLFHDGKPATSSYRLMIKRALEGLDLEVWGDPQKGMDLIYVKDFCQMVWRQLFADVDKSGMYNVGTGRMTSLDELVSTIIEVFAKDTSTSKKVYRPEKHDCVNYFMNVDKARKNLGYEPQYGPRELFEDYKREMELNRFAGFFSERYGDASAYR